MDDTWYEIPWRIFCIGELGSMFCDRYKGKIGDQFTCRVLDDPLQLTRYCDSDPYCLNEHRMLVAEYEQDTWNKYLENDEIKAILQNMTLKVIIIHPVNNAVPSPERQFVRLMGDDPVHVMPPVGKVILAMPDRLHQSMESVCKAIYDMIAAIYIPGFCNIDFFDLVGPGKNNQYGMVYEASCAHDGQMVQAAADIRRRVEKEMPVDEIGAVYLNISSGRNLKLAQVCEVAGIIEDTFNENTKMIWAHVINESEFGMTLVIYRNLG